MSLFVRNLELGRMLHEYHLSKSSLAVMEEKLSHVRNNVNPALWPAETFQDNEDFYEAGYQPGDEVELFASDGAGQLAKQRLALLELAAGKAAPPEVYSSACECAPPVSAQETELWEVSKERKKWVAPPSSPASDGYWVSPKSSPENQLGHDLRNVALGRSVGGGFKTTPSSSPSPAPPMDSPTADERAEALQLQNFLLIAASDQPVVGECWPDRNRLVKPKEPSMNRSGTKPPNDAHFWPIFAGADGGIVNPVARKMSFKRDAPDRMLAAPLSGDDNADGADGESLVCCFALTIGRR